MGTFERIIFTSLTIPHEAVTQDVVFDTNVWLQIHGFAAAMDDRCRAYSALYKKLLEAGRTIYLTQGILSEYVGTSLAFTAKMNGWSRGQKQKIHQHPQYTDWMSTIADEASFIREDSNPLNDNFAGLDVPVFCSDACCRSIDFNDLLIVEACKREGLTLVTDDADFKGESVRLVSFNQRLR